MTPSATHTIRMPQTLSAASLSLLRQGESWNKFAISALEKEVAARRTGADASALTTTLVAALDMARQLEQEKKGGEM